MPLVLAPLAVVLGEGVMAWGARALMLYGAHKLWAEDRVQELVDYLINKVASYIGDKLGLHLDENDPFSDRSFCNAFYAKTGVQFRTMLDKDSIREDLERYAILQVQEKTGFQMKTTSFKDIEGLKLDLVNIGLYTVQQKTGIPIAAVSGTPQEWGAQIKQQLIDYAMAQMTERYAADVQAVVGNISEFVDLEALAGQINQRLGDMGSTQDIDVKGLAMSIAEQVAAGAVGKFQMTAMKQAKGTRRAMQNREAQRRFRQKWGDRRVYQPVR